MRRKTKFDRAFPEKNIRDCRWAPIEKFQQLAYYYLLAVPIVRLTCFTLRGHIAQDAQVSSLTTLNIFMQAIPESRLWRKAKASLLVTLNIFMQAIPESRLWRKVKASLLVTLDIFMQAVPESRLWRKVVYLTDTELLSFVFLYGGVFFSSEVALIPGSALIIVSWCVS